MMETKAVKDIESFREITLKCIDESCEFMAMTRRNFILKGEPAEEIDKYIADKFNEWVRKTEGMSEMELFLFAVTKKIQQKEKEKQEDK